MAVDYFLKLDGIQGESTDSKHKDQIELASFSWGAAHSGSAATGGGAGAGKATVKDLRFVQRTQKSTPQLLGKLMAGQHIKSGILTGRKSTKDQIEFIKIELTDVLVTSYDVTAEDDLPVEEIGLSFAAFKLTYVPSSASGAAGTPVSMGWDLKQNKAV